jgi:AbrB family looped-hinge helix DNA binding protein
MSTDEREEQTTRVTRKGQVTIPKKLREEFGLEAGDHVRWEIGEDGIVVRKATGSAGRGMLVDGDVSEEKREEIATELAAEIREKRHTEWNPE